MRCLVLLLLARSCAGKWIEANNENAIPKTLPGHSIETTVKDQDACATPCKSNSTCVMWTFNHNSGHCFWAFDGSWKPLSNAHTNSGCDDSKVKGCSASPSPGPGPSPPGPSPKFDGKVRPQADNSSAAYMIPPYKSNHASTIEVLPDGTIAVAWFSGAKEEASGCAIVFATLPAGSSQFTKAATLSEKDGYSNQNPVLFYDTKTNILHLYHSQAKAESGESKSVIMELQSTDKGKSWTKPKALFTFPGAFPRNRVIPSLDGGLLFPIYDAGNDNPFKANYAIIEKSNQARSDWTKLDIAGSGDCVQPTCVRLTDSRLRCWFRDRRAGYIYTADSKDDAKTWTKPKPSVLPNPNVGIEANILTSGNIVMIFNNYNKSTAGPNGRTPLNVGLSKDNGTSWHIKKLQVHDDDKPAAEGKLEYSYPSVLQTADGLIHITYTYDRQTIKYRRVTEAWIMSKDDDGDEGADEAEEQEGGDIDYLM